MQTVPKHKVNDEAVLNFKIPFLDVTLLSQHEPAMHLGVEGAHGLIPKSHSHVLPRMLI